MKSIEQIKADNREEEIYEEHRADRILLEVKEELLTARKNHEKLNSLHEAYAVILEEVCELWDEVRKKPVARSREQVQKELIQIAAMAVRTLLECA